MALNVSLVGRTYPPTEPYEVSREAIRAFATALGDTNPLYYDREAAIAAGHTDVVAPPSFLTVLEDRAERLQVAADPELGMDYSRVVHGAQRFVHHRPVRPGDSLVIVARIDDIKRTGVHGMVTVACDVQANGTEHVATMFCTMVVRGSEEAAPA